MTVDLTVRNSSLDLFFKPYQLSNNPKISAAARVSSGFCFMITRWHKKKEDRNTSAIEEAGTSQRSRGKEKLGCKP
jgi:hypothetical protein